MTLDEQISQEQTLISEADRDAREYKELVKQTQPRDSVRRFYAREMRSAALGAKRWHQERLNILRGEKEQQEANSDETSQENA